MPKNNPGPFTTDDPIFPDADDLWAAYSKAGPTGDRDLAIRAARASFEPGQTRVEQAIQGRQINLLDLAAVRIGWQAAYDEWESGLEHIAPPQ